MSSDPDAPFEKRCEIARGALSQLQRDLEKIASNDFRQLQRKTEEAEKLAAKMKSKEARAFVLKTEEDARTIITDASQRMRRIVWEHGADALRRILGSDAVDFVVLEDLAKN